MSIQELFETFVSENGICQPNFHMHEVQLNLVRTYYEWLQPFSCVDHSEAGCDLQVYLGLIHSNEVNACAFYVNSDTPCIGVNVGTIDRLNIIFLNISRYRQLYMHYSKKYKGASPDDIANMIQSTSAAGPRGVTLDYDDAIVDTKQALRFILRHELTHIVNGHLRMIQRLNLRAYVDERVDLSIANNLLFAADSRAMEFDADCCAASWWCGVFMTKYLASHNLSAEKFMTFSVKELEKYQSDLVYGFRQWAGSVSVVFKMFGDRADEFATTHFLMYPPVRVRQISVLRTVIDHIHQRYNEQLAEILKDHVWEEMELAEYWYTKSLLQTYEIKGLELALGEDGYKCIDDLIGHWQTSLRGRLLPYAYGSYLPP